MTARLRSSVTRSADTTTLMGMPRIVQAWGTTPERAI